MIFGIAFLKHIHIEKTTQTVDYFSVAERLVCLLYCLHISFNKEYENIS